MSTVRITLPSLLTTRHRRVVLKYFEHTDRLSPQEWQIAFNTFDALGQASVTIGRRRMRFQQVYNRYIDRQYADRFMAQLMALTELETDAEVLQQQYAFDILAMLEREGLYHENVADSEYLAAYCLYWWAAYARGYRFELVIFRDLRASNIAFVAHDLRRRTERRSPYDLIVQRQVGDIKNTTYFLSSARAQPLHCDFYITRLYHPRRRRYVSIVVLTEAAWSTLDGDVIPVSLETAAHFFPQPVQIVLEGQRFIIVPFDLWKEKVKRRQPEEV